MLACVVLLPNTNVSALVRTRPRARDARGRAVATPADQVTVRGPFPANAVELPDQTWRLRVDDRLWPLDAGDELADDTRTWVVVSARVTRVPGAPDVDSVVCICTLEPPAHL